MVALVPKQLALKEDQMCPPMNKKNRSKSTHWNVANFSYPACLHGNISFSHGKVVKVLLVHKISSNCFEGLYDAVERMHKYGGNTPTINMTANYLLG